MAVPPGGGKTKYLGASAAASTLRVTSKNVSSSEAASKALDNRILSNLSASLQHRRLQDSNAAAADAGWLTLINILNGFISEGITGSSAIIASCFDARRCEWQE